MRFDLVDDHDSPRLNAVLVVRPFRGVNTEKNFCQDGEDRAMSVGQRSQIKRVAITAPDKEVVRPPIKGRLQMGILEKTSEMPLKFVEPCSDPVCGRDILVR
jgi:hypothetical protein